MKKTARRILSSFLCAVIPLSVFSCAGVPADPAETASTDAGTPADADPGTEIRTETDAPETEIPPEPETDPAEEPEPEQTPEEEEVPGTVELYQLAPESQSLMMSYVVVTPNRKIVVIDGGIDGAGMNAPPYLPSAIRAILGLGEGEYFEIEAWFLSHIHWDHYYELAKMLKKYKETDNYKINNIYFDFPEYGVEWRSSAGDSDYDQPTLDVLINGMDKYYGMMGFDGLDGADIPEERRTAPEGSKGYYYNLLNGAVINEERIAEGLTLTVDGVDFNILMTWWKGAQSINSTSVIIKMEYGGKSVLFLGDCASDEGRRLIETVGAETVRSDYVQMGHHGQGGPDEPFYKKIGAKDSIRLWPTPDWVWTNANSYAIGKTRSWMGLPYEAKDFRSEGCFDTGTDFVAGCYEHYPKRSVKVDSWTEEVLNDQRVAVFTKEKP